MKKSQEQEAWAVAVELNKLGIKPVVQGEWAVFKPAPSFELLMRIRALPPKLLESMVLRVEDQP